MKLAPYARPRFHARSTISKRGLIAPSLILAGLTSLAVLGGCDSFSPRVYEHRSMQVAHIPGTALEIKNANGSIKALGTDRADVSIEVELYGRDTERLTFATVHADRLGDNTLSVWVEWPGGNRQRGEGSSIDIQIPNTLNINARSSNGRIAIEGLSGIAELNTSNGSISVERHDGSIHATTSNANIKAEHVSGEIEMYSSNGNAIITDAFGPIRAETSNGNIFVSTMDGNEGPVRIRTSNGRIDLDLGDGFVGVLKCQTSNGKVLVSGIENAQFIESSGHSVELRVGDSDEVSAVKTSNGSVRVRNRHAEPSQG